ncbi:MAG: Trk system potassium transporter TrkA, partial [Clostridia bacterium]|nr:Trk system potassium transporter TrkA [Clostridia bacterium]
MNIIVAGCGKIGKTILANLSEEKHDLTALDNDPSVVEEVVGAYDVMGICGNATDYDKLSDAGVKTADLFIAVTSSDEINMLSCFAAKRMGAKRTVARIRNTENNDSVSLDFMKKQIDLSLSINPELLTAKAIYNVLKLPSATNVEMFSSHRFEMLEFILKDDYLDGVSLIELRKRTKEKFLVCTVRRGDDFYIPQGNFRLKTGDKIGIIASGTDTQKILKTLGILHKPTRDVILMGGGKTSYYLAKLLLESKILVKVIERDEKKCEDFLEALPGVIVIHGNGMDQDVLREEGIASTDAFVALTGKDEENILISFYAMSQKVPKVVSKINGEELSKIAEKLGLESMVSPKKIVADVIVQYARALKNSEGSTVETLYRIMNGGAEALEFNVLPDFVYADIPLKSVRF